jgi:ATP-binding protein involved in chromosome partitioning
VSQTSHQNAPQGSHPSQASYALEALRQIQDTDFKQDIVSLGFVQELNVEKSHISCDLLLPTPVMPGKQALKAQVEATLRGLPGIASATVTLRSEVSTQPQGGRNTIPGVKNIIAVGSGKGGVGKSTTAVNLACALSSWGARVGLVDGDIYGPTLPIMLGAREHDLLQNERGIIPVEAHGIRFMSMGLLSKGSAPLIWRGPMAHKAVQESLLHVDWGELDYLLVDMPPGTGDVHLTLVQTVPVTGAVIVSTPQDVGLIISMKTFKLFEQTHVPLLGIIENMSYHICPHCDKREYIFGHGSVAEEAKKYDMPFLGEIALDRQIREHSDQGTPIVLSNPTAPAAQDYFKIAERIAVQVSLRNHAARPIPVIEETDAPSQTFSV